jgi:imidazolonepropionase-like amidohydrolase
LRVSAQLATVRAALGGLNMRRPILAALLAATASIATAAPTPKDQLLVPPANAEHFVLVSEAGKHGDQWHWTTPDGANAYRFSMALRGWIYESDETIRADATGNPSDIRIRGVSPSGDQAESYHVEGGQGAWTGAIDQGSAPAAGKFYLANNGINAADGFMVDRLVAAGDKGIDLLPSGHATLIRAGNLAVDGPGGKKQLELDFIKGVQAAPYPVWLDQNRHFWGYAGIISVIPVGYEGSVSALRTFQDAATADAVKTIAHQFLTADATRPVLFDHVKLFDADKGRFIDDRAVLVRNGKVATIAAGGSIKPAAETRTIDGRGKTLVPGLWDSHRHMGDDWGILSNVAEGITDYRSPGNEIDRMHDVFKRRTAGDLLAPEGWVSVIVDRKNPLAAQGSIAVSSPEEAIAAVDKIKAAGMWGVKFYTSMNPAWIAPAAAEAHKLGLHVHGHIPAGMRPLDAVHAGYDEITHINFVMMQAMPQDVVDKANTAARIEGPAKYAKDVDLNAPPMRNFIAELARRHTYVDPTLVAFEDQFMKEKGGEPGPATAPYADIVPAAVTRSFKSEGYPLVNGLTRADFQKSFAKMVALTGALHKAGVPIVAGTDGEGMELVRELELYHQAGFTPAEAIQSATIVPARLVGADKRLGSIAVGKDADMLLVEGDASKDLGALRRVRTVVMKGAVMDGDALRTAAGYSGMPK